MLTADVKISGFSAEEWIALGRLLRRPSTSAAARPRGRGGIIALTTGTKLRKLFSTERGRLDPHEQQPWPEPLPKLVERHKARWGLELGTGVLEDLMDRFAARLRPEHDLTQQVLELLAVFRELEAEGALTTHPARIAQWPIPSERMIATALDSICGDGKVIVFGAFDRGELETAIAAHRRGAAFDLIVGPGELRDEMGLLSGDWTRDYRHLSRAVVERLGPLSLGCYAETGTMRRLIERDTPGAWAAAVAARDVILSPVSPAVAVPLGLDVGRAALATVRHVAERVGLKSWLSSQGPLGAAFERVQELSDRDLRDVLGFDPLALLRKLFASDDPH